MCSHSLLKLVSTKLLVLQQSWYLQSLLSDALPFKAHHESHLEFVAACFTVYCVARVEKKLEFMFCVKLKSVQPHYDKKTSSAQNRVQSFE